MTYNFFLGLAASSTLDAVEVFINLVSAVNCYVYYWVCCGKSTWFEMAALPGVYTRQLQSCFLFLDDFLSQALPAGTVQRTVEVSKL